MKEDEKIKKWLKEHNHGDIFDLTFKELEELCKYLGKSLTVEDIGKRVKEGQ